MTLLCRPKGRGNWRVIEIGIVGDADLFGLRKGDVVSFSTAFRGHHVLRIVEVRP